MSQYSKREQMYTMFVMFALITGFVNFGAAVIFTCSMIFIEMILRVLAYEVVRALKTPEK